MAYLCCVVRLHCSLEVGHNKLSAHLALKDGDSVIENILFMCKYQITMTLSCIVLECLNFKSHGLIANLFHYCFIYYWAEFLNCR